MAYLGLLSATNNFIFLVTFHRHFLLTRECQSTHFQATLDTLAFLVLKLYNLILISGLTRMLFQATPMLLHAASLLLLIPQFKCHVLLIASLVRVRSRFWNRVGNRYHLIFHGLHLFIAHLLFLPKVKEHTILVAKFMGPAQFAISD